jgi:hypothetical protein
MQGFLVSKPLPMEEMAGLLGGAGTAGKLS